MLVLSLYRKCDGVCSTTATYLYGSRSLLLLLSKQLWYTEHLFVCH